MKNKLFLLLILSTMLLFTNNNLQSAKAFYTEDPVDLFDYNPHFNKKFTIGKNYGEYYKTGFIGYHKVVEVQKVSLIFEVIDRYKDFGDIEENPLLTIPNISEYNIINATFTSEPVSVGFIEIIDKFARGEDTLSVGASNSPSFQNYFAYKKQFSSIKLNSQNISTTWDLNNLHPDQTITYGIGRIAAYLKIDIKSSYIEENGLFGSWNKIPNESKGAYSAYLYLFGLVTYVYPDQTFGTKKLGLFHRISYTKSA